jgi:hypothetical protein
MLASTSRYLAILATAPCSFFLHGCPGGGGGGTGMETTESTTTEGTTTEGTTTTGADVTGLDEGTATGTTGDHV